VSRSHLALLLPVLLCGTPVLGAPVTLDGVTFSDERGGFVIRDGRGRGTPDDPFVLREEIFDPERPAVLTIRGIDRRFGNRVGGSPPMAFVLVKVVRNRTGRVWHGFEMELREILSRPSPYEDGLSFAQAEGEKRIYRADRFSEAWQTDEPRDAVTFYGGRVAPGETVRLRVVITDFSPTWQFYLLQRRQVPLARAPVRGSRVAVVSTPPSQLRWQEPAPCYRSAATSAAPANRSRLAAAALTAPASAGSCRESGRHNCGDRPTSPPH